MARKRLANILLGFGMLATIGCMAPKQQVIREIICPVNGNGISVTAEYRDKHFKYERKLSPDGVSYIDETIKDEKDSLYFHQRIEFKLEENKYLPGGRTGDKRDP